MKLKRFIDERMKNSEKIRAVGYIRVSTFNQADNTSFGYQEKRIKEYCKLKSWELVKIYKEIESGEKSNRNQYQLMIDHLFKSDTNCVLVSVMDRLYRSPKDWLYLEPKLDKTGKFIATTEGIDSRTPTGKQQIDMITMVARWEVQRITERLMSGRVENFKNTGKIGSKNKGCTGVLPFGYYYNEDGDLKIDRERAETVKTIFKMRIDKASLGRITKDLNENGILTQRGNKFSRYSVNSILKNVFYAGDYKYSGWIQHDHHKEIISMNDWCKVNKRTKKTEKFKSRRNSKVYKFPVIAPMIPEGLKSEQYRVFN